jgi:hypothetical protein
MTFSCGPCSVHEPLLHERKGGQKPVILPSLTTGNEGEWDGLPFIVDTEPDAFADFANIERHGHRG